MLPALLLAVAMSAAATPMTVDEIVARHLEARGGAQKLAAVQNLKVSGKAFFGGDDFTITAEFAQVRKRANQIRTEVTLQGLTGIDAYDGQQSWSVDPFQGRKDPFRTTADEARGLAQDADLDGALIGWREKGNQVSYLGTEDVDGTPAQKLRIALHIAHQQVEQIRHRTDDHNAHDHEVGTEEIGSVEHHLSQSVRRGDHLRRDQGCPAEADGNPHGGQYLRHRGRDDHVLEHGHSRPR